MRIIALCYAAVLVGLIGWLLWEWRADVQYRKRWLPPAGRRIGDRLPPKAEN